MSAFGSIRVTELSSTTGGERGKLPSGSCSPRTETTPGEIASHCRRSATSAVGGAPVDGGRRSPKQTGRPATRAPTIVVVVYLESPGGPVTGAGAGGSRRVGSYRPGAKRNFCSGSTMARICTMQPSPLGQRQGRTRRVQRSPVTASRSPPTFSIPGMPPLTMRVLCAGSQLGKASRGSWPACSCFHSSMRCGCVGPSP